MRTPTLESHLYQPGNGFMRRRAQRTPPPVKLSEPQNRMVMEYQQLCYRLALRLLRSEDLTTPWVVGVTSSIRGEGKTTTSIGLAAALAQEEQGKVALIEANFQNPTLNNDFGIESRHGLAGYLTGRCPLREACTSTDIDHLTLVAAGNPSRIARGLTAQKLRGSLRRQLPQVVKQLGDEFPYIVLDLPPILGNVDTEEMVRLAHGTILVVRTGVTPLERFRQAALSLEGRLLGVVHLGDRPSVPRWLSQLISE